MILGKPDDSSSVKTLRLVDTREPTNVEAQSGKKRPTEVITVYSDVTTGLAASLVTYFLCS
jgi:hypothetical protein